MNAIYKLTPIEQITAESNSEDIREHERTFAAFVQLLAIATLHVVTCLVALAVGGVEHHWMMTFFLVIVASGAAAFGALSRLAWRPGAAILLVALACLALLG